MSPLSQREIVGAPCVPFTTDMDRLLAQRDQIAPVTTPELFERLWRGSMPGLVSGQTPNRNVFYSSYLSTYMEIVPKQKIADLTWQKMEVIIPDMVLPIIEKYRDTTGKRLFRFYGTIGLKTF